MCVVVYDADVRLFRKKYGEDKRNRFVIFPQQVALSMKIAHDMFLLLFC